MVRKKAPAPASVMASTEGSPGGRSREKLARLHMMVAGKLTCSRGGNQCFLSSTKRMREEIDCGLGPASWLAVGW